VHNTQLLIKVKDDTSLARDSLSKAVINTDTVGYETYLEQRNKLLAEKRAVEQNTKDIHELKQEIGDIKGMLTTILNAIQK
jgi:hypothetical protein